MRRAGRSARPSVNLRGDGALQPDGSDLPHELVEVLPFGSD